MDDGARRGHVVVTLSLSSRHLIFVSICLYKLYDVEISGVSGDYVRSVNVTMT